MANIDRMVINPINFNLEPAPQHFDTIEALNARGSELSALWLQRARIYEMCVRPAHHSAEHARWLSEVRRLDARIEHLAGGLREDGAELDWRSVLPRLAEEKKRWEDFVRLCGGAFGQIFVDVEFGVFESPISVDLVPLRQHGQGQQQQQQRQQHDVRQFSGTSVVGLSQFFNSFGPPRSISATCTFPAFHSSLKYTLVRDFAYHVLGPKHYGLTEESQRVELARRHRLDASMRKSQGKEIIIFKPTTSFLLLLSEDGTFLVVPRWLCGSDRVVGELVYMDSTM